MKAHNICIVGLGYVGLPLGYALAKVGHSITGYDINEARIKELQDSHDSTNELTDGQLKEVDINYSTDPAVVGESEVIIMTLPTPIDLHKKPDLTILKTASATIGKHLKEGSIVVYESTVYPGTTEEICGPILEEASGLTCGKDFHLGYSPERINPGDKEHTVDKIIKVVAGQDDATTDILCDLYGSAITAGIHRAPSIKVAEMGKAIENAQRDLNIAFVNEIAVMCDKLGISSSDVLAAAGTKWNFLPFKPGLVGGHCIGVDPYYLVEKASQLGMETHVISAGRKINDGMGAVVAKQIGESLGDKAGSILVLGITFKENIPDTRNSKVGDVIKSLKEAGHTVAVHDPFYPTEELTKLGYDPGSLDATYDAVALLVTHQEYLDAGEEGLIKATKEGGTIYDLKCVLDKNKIESAGRTYRAL